MATKFGKWRPIETAPKDGTQIIIAVADADDEFEPGWAFWSERFNNWMIPTTARGYEMYPTHWMPMPEPPLKSREAK